MIQDLKVPSPDRSCNTEKAYYNESDDEECNKAWAAWNKYCGYAET